VRHGAYELLDKLGFRWFFKHPAWDVAPSSLIELGTLDGEVNEPFFWWRSVGIGRQGSPGTGYQENWKARNRLLGFIEYPMGHTYLQIATYAYGTVAALYAEHPDWFTPSTDPYVPGDPLNWDGISAGWQLKPDEPGVIEMAIDYARDNYLSDPRYGAAPISPKDGWGWVPPWDGTGPGGTDIQTVTDKVFGLSNAVALALKDEFPDNENYIQTYCYAGYSGVPSFDLERNVLVQIATSFNYGGLTLEEQIDGYADRGATVGIRGYLDVWGWLYDGPGFRLDELNIIKDSADRDVRVYNTEATDSWGARGPTFYVASKLLWDPSLNIQSLKDEFYDKAFGPASELMKHYYEDIATGEAAPYNMMRDAFLTLDEAETQAAGNEEILERIRHIQLYWYFVWKYHYVKISNIEDLQELKDFYTFVTQLDTLYIIQSPNVESRAVNSGGIGAELLARELTNAEIDALIDRTPPTTAETAIWMDEALAAFPEIPLPTTGNVALDRMMITFSTPPLGAPSILTDGIVTTTPYLSVGNDLQWVKVDLEQVIAISQVNLRHYFADTRSYHDVIIQVSEDGINWVTVFNNDADDTAGQGIGTDAEYVETAAGLDVVVPPILTRYVRCWSNGNTRNTANHYTELEVYAA
ncbi:DUF4838 domain-containing protein, partial [Chloroflexota bacterium]